MMRIYVDGVEQASTSVSGTIDAVTDPLVIGRNVTNTSFAWHGFIDEVGIYDRALSAAEIQAIASSSNIPGDGVHTISLTSALPDITDPVTIDGYTQPGATPNTLAVGDNAVLEIELDGHLVGGTGTALTILAGNSTVRRVGHQSL